MDYARLQEMYTGKEFYWGREPNDFARKALEFLPDARVEGQLRAIDLGAGEGRDAVLFASRGVETLALDIAPNALEKARRLAREKGVRLETNRGDVNEVRFSRPFDLVYSIGAIQYIEPQKRAARFEHFKEGTNPGGIHALFAFVDDPRLPPAPDWGPGEHIYHPGELPGYYAGWGLLHFQSLVFDDDSAGIPHKHAAEEYVFEKPVQLG